MADFTTNLKALGFQLTNPHLRNNFYDAATGQQIDLSNLTAESIQAHLKKGAKWITPVAVVKKEASPKK